MQAQDKDNDFAATLNNLHALFSEALDKAPDSAFHQLPLESLDVLYSLGYEFFEQGRYEQAEHYFQVLANLNVVDPKYWVGVGAARQMQKKYDTAIAAYSAARLLDHDNQNPEPALQMANCYASLGNTQDALRALEAAEDSAKQKNNQRVLDHVALLRTIWSN